MTTSSPSTGSGRLAGKTALISGAASGIGLASARRFALEGAKVALTDISPEKGEALAAEMTAAGHDVFYRDLNVVDPEQWQAVTEEVVGRWGKLDILLNSAGIGWVAPLLEMSLEVWRRTTSINLDGTFLGTQAAVRAMKATGGGSIVNISSVLGFVGIPNISAYAASKGGVRLFTKAAAIECAELGLNVRINSVHPGYIETPMVMRRFDKVSEDEKAAGQKALERQHPLGRLGKPEEIAAMILYLASDEASFVTGTEFLIDGGYTAR